MEAPLPLKINFKGGPPAMISFTPAKLEETAGEGIGVVVEARDLRDIHSCIDQVAGSGKPFDVLRGIQPPSPRSSLRIDNPIPGLPLPQIVRGHTAQSRRHANPVPRFRRAAGLVIVGHDFANLPHSGHQKRQINGLIYHDFTCA